MGSGSAIGSDRFTRMYPAYTAPPSIAIRTAITTPVRTLRRMIQESHPKNVELETSAPTSWVSVLMNGRAMNLPEVVSHKKWLATRKALLAEEKEFTRQRDALNTRRRELPMV